MSNRILSKDATVTSIADKLNDPEEYIRGILANLHEALKTESNSRVTIGVTGGGKVPHYKIDISVVLFDGWKPMYLPNKVFDGRTHKQNPAYHRHSAGY